jgi:Aldo/keto reductase family
MRYTTLGRSGLKISRIALGGMSFGDTTRGFNEWALGDDEAEPLFRQAVELGITFWDTANGYGYGYGYGTSEEIVGRTASPRRRRCGARHYPHRRGDQCPRRALHPASAHRLLKRFGLSRRWSPRPATRSATIRRED